uniref:Ig-like domain-containing protein n=1 Tax=Crocodylus porosus TaxID=8502 RepID=A0A7M4E745_CROPO
MLSWEGSEEFTDIDTLKVSQTPTKIIASAGQSVEVTCTWENHDRVERYRVTWEKQNLSSEGPSTEKLKEEVCNTSSTVHTNKAMLELKPVNVNNTGIYFCEINVEIPYLKRGKGNGTTLIVHWSSCLPPCLLPKQGVRPHRGCTPYVSSLSTILCMCYPAADLVNLLQPNRSAHVDM